MKVSYNWLKNYVKDLPEAEKVAETFTFHICELESLDKLETFGKTDWIFDIKVLPDRAHDLLSHKGVAKDLAGISGFSFNDIKYEVPKGETTKLEVKIESPNCRRYMGRVVRGVKVGPSPEWIKNYLESLDQRSINNIVDATNIVMFDLGQPIHAFDLEKLASEKIIVRDAHEGETMTTLDGKEVKFSKSNMVISDDSDVLAIAGVKGGKKAEVDKDTKNIVIEVANFNPTSVRKTAKGVNIYTDAVKRFENDLSPEVSGDAMNEITALILEMCPDAIFEDIVDIYPQKQEQRSVLVSSAYINRRLGSNFSHEEIKNVWERLKFEYEEKNGNFEIKIPFSRLDLTGPHDLSEEVIRVLGYDRLEEKLPEVNCEQEQSELFTKILCSRNKLLNEGYSEVMTYTFRDEGEMEVLASASNKKFLRTNLTDGMKESLKLNQSNLPLLGLGEVKIFEIGTVFKKSGEEMHIAFNVKKEIKEIKLDEFCKDMGDVKKAFKEEINKVSKLSEEKFKMWSLYPFISRDVAVWMPEGENPETLKKILVENGTELLVKEPYLFDSFTKDGKTSYAFRIVFQSYDRTLTDEEISKIMERINARIAEHKDWQIR